MDRRCCRGREVVVMGKNPKQSERMKLRWQNPLYRARMLKMMRSPQAVENQRRGTKAMWTDERRRAWSEELSNRIATNPEYAAQVRKWSQMGMEASRKMRPMNTPKYLKDMTIEEREYYHFLTRRKKFTKAEALSMLGDQRRAARNQEAAD
jgi:hypothetical protein